jgi:hypothetical protein
MSALIIVRLHPVKPMAPDAFTDAVKDLVVTAYDETFPENGVAEVALGKAQGLATVRGDTVDATATGIIQHYQDDSYKDPTNPIDTVSGRFLLAAATAVIVANPPTPHAEYPTQDSYDLRLELTRDGQKIADRTIDYNITVVEETSLPTAQTDYFGMTASAYATIPPVPPAGTVAPVQLLSDDGTPPAFADLAAAIDDVLALDPGATSLAAHAPLTTAQSNDIAAELVWNRGYNPPPTEPAHYGLMYTDRTAPQTDQNPAYATSDLDRDREQFEGDYTGYHATNDANVTRLAGYVFAASAAVQCERLSLQAVQAGFPFPVPNGPTGKDLDTEVVLSMPPSTDTPPTYPPLDPSFGVPAAYFYALAAGLPAQSDADHRFDLARYAPELRSRQDLQTAIDSDVITVTEAFWTAPGSSAINPDQAARRLACLGAASDSLPSVVLEASTAQDRPLAQLVALWLAYPGTTATIDQSFWPNYLTTPGGAYLTLVLEVVTGNYSQLMTVITDPASNGGLGIQTVQQLAALTDKTWENLFLPVGNPTPPPRIDLLPPFTQPGTPAERVAAFLRYLHRFFTVGVSGTGLTYAVGGTIPTLGLPVGDVFTTFAYAYAGASGNNFTFNGTWDATSVASAVATTFPDDPAAQTWLTQALDIIAALVKLTAFADTELQFALMEALYARGFTGTAGVQALSPEDFQYALTGSVAYPYAADIQAAAGGSTAAAPPADGGFAPVNGGSLADCVPPPHLSPFGPAAYLAELLLVSATSTCEQPTGSDPAQQIGTLLAGRRGPLTALHATAANLRTPLPIVDLGNESLEALAAGVASGSGATGGAVFDTNGTALAGHQLEPGDPQGHNPATLFAAIPEHSSPAAVDIAPAGYAAYAALRSAITAPQLPYDQALDVNRGYLAALGSGRFAAMRRFRRDITEFVLDPADADEPAGFQTQLWRYPVRHELALEYLGLSEDEYGLLYQSDGTQPPLWQLYGFVAETVNDGSWTDVVAQVSEFLRRTGLDYCAFLELWRSGYVSFARSGGEDGDTDFPECEPCPGLRIDFGSADGVSDALHRLIVFIRLWRRLAEHGHALGFQELADICTVLGLFTGTATVNPDFPRQLAALLMLRADLRLPLTTRPSGTTPTDRVPVLALWATTPTAAAWDEAVRLLLDGIEDRFGEERDKTVSPADLDALSRLAGFDPATASADSWHALPTHTLRFAEVLGKITASEFSIGEMLFLFTVDPHLDGDDPFPVADDEENADDPLALPEAEPTEGDGRHSLWALRRALLDAHEDGDDSDGAENGATAWSWRRITTALRDEFGFAAPSTGPDPLIELGEHFFPHVLERSGHRLNPAARQYATPLPVADTSPLMWTAEAGPFDYDTVDQQLTVRLPLRDIEVIDRLRELRPLNATEQVAVRNLYFAPRAALAPFAAIFENFAEAVDRLVQEPDEQERFAFFQREFGCFHRRCRAIARHLAEHVEAVTGHEPEPGAAWRILRALNADGNLAQTPWEDDSGQPPAATWGPRPGGGAFAALLGLVGTGLLGEYRTLGGDPVWREVRGPMSAFGRIRDAHNAPVPTVLPAMSLTLTPDQHRHVDVRNGFALRDRDGEPLGGAERFTVRWKGSLLIEHSGEYRFSAEAPADDGWRVVLRRGRRTWAVLAHGLPGEDGHGHAPALPLRRGVYEIAVEFEQREPTFAGPDDIRPAHTGFRLDYAGPDSGGEPIPVPLDRLFVDHVDTTLGTGLGPQGDRPGLDPDENAIGYLDGRYVSSLRDIRRTYQRAFKALLFSGRFGLSARPDHAFHQSELGYLLDHPEAFAGTSYYRTGAASFGTHHAWFDPDLLPVADPYQPQPTQDQRTSPSPQRQAALFDWWERVFDYCRLREETGQARERPTWLLFAEAAEDQPDDPDELLRHLGIDLRHAPLVLTYWADSEYTLTAADLTDERWTTRAWHADCWLRALREHFAPADIGEAHPYLWAADDPGAESASGNADLTRFVQDGCFENGRPRRYEPVRRLNDLLRERARTALLGYLCGMNRVPLPWASGTYALHPGDLANLLLQDVAAGIGQRASRIEEATGAVHAFVQRARLGLEPGFAVSPAFAELWDRRFATYRVWEACRRREVYGENWIEWNDLRAARRIEAFANLEDRLRRDGLSVAVPGGGAWWPDAQRPGHPSLALAQSAEPRTEALLAEPVEGFGLSSAPDRAARQSWLAPPRLPVAIANLADSNSNSNSAGVQVHAADDSGDERLPLWLEAAVGLGTPFVRVAAAGLPPAAAGFTPRQDDAAFCTTCGGEHQSLVDEYYFWLAQASFFDADDAAQDADSGVDVSAQSDQTSAWEQPGQLPGMLSWTPRPLVHLHWSRVRHGEFEPPRRSAKGLAIDPEESIRLDFRGRTVDSLRFEVAAGRAPIGYPGPADPSQPPPPPAPPTGFRYDLASDTAAPLPEVVTVLPDPTGLPGGLTAYPFFAFVDPGAPVEPLSPFSAALAVAGALRTHGAYEAALKWYESAYAPLGRDNTWADGSPAVRDRAVLLAYLETLLDWADAALSGDAPEAAQRAAVILGVLDRLLGPRPATVLSADDATAMTLAAFTTHPAPLNPRLLALYDRAADRLALVHDALDRQRLPIASVYWDAEHDKACGCRRGHYRFTHVLQQALDLAEQVRGLGAMLLTAYEKGDAEALAALHAVHERQLAELTLAAREHTWRESDWQVQALQLGKQGAQERYRYYTGLLANGLNAGESAYVALNGSAMRSHASANTSEATAQAMEFIPDIAFGVAGLGPYFSTTIPIGNKIAQAFGTAARIMNTEGEISGINGALSLTQGGWDRRTQEWQLQVTTTGIEIDQIQRQILAAERHRDAALRELNDQQRLIEQTGEVSDFLRDKFTNDELYLHLQRETAGLHRRMYDLAVHAARRAQSAYNYERGHTKRRFLPEAGWDGLHEGLLAGERLQLSLRQMESAYLDLNRREYEVTRHLSLRQEFPEEFLRLKLTGRAEIEVPESLFDNDYPGQYMRRIKNVTVTLPCVVGPYTGVQCQLTLLGSTTRIDPRATPVRECAHGGACGCEDPVGDYRAAPEDPRVVRSYAATEAIATSSGQSDAGLFELSFRDERYLPFEFAGAVSRWRIELPPENNRFDLDTVTDLVLHLDYTAREGGEPLRRAAAAGARDRLPGAGSRLFDVYQDLPDAWSRLRGAEGEAVLPLRLGREHFPYLPGGPGIEITRTTLILELDDADERGDHRVRFVAGHEHEHGPDVECGCRGREVEVEVECPADPERPGLFRGVLDLPLGPLAKDRPRDLGEFRLRLPGHQIHRAFVLCEYARR